ncbi:MAG TPA: B12-binding domain-containing protein [Phycisphaerae bacterium]|nr:B12-binding domain-containing protein [Phycisphaerae bacterium]
MYQPSTLDRFFEPLLAGDRKTCRQFITEQLERANNTVTDLYFDLLWPTMQRLDECFRQNRISVATEHMATRISRSIADQLQQSLVQMPANGKTIMITCADDEPEELGAQMCSDLFESRGWNVYFLGGGVPMDEISQLIGQIRPDILLIFGTKPSGVSQVRTLIDHIRSISSNPTMNIMMSGGVFNRAEDLWKEVQADLYAPTAQEAIPMAEAAQPRKPEIRLPGVPKKRRRRRRPPLAMETATA